MKKEKVYAIDVHWDFAKCFKVKASTEDEAIGIVKETMRKIISAEPNYAINPIDHGFEAMEDYEASCSGEGDTEDTIEYR